MKLSINSIPYMKSNICEVKTHMWIFSYIYIDLGVAPRLMRIFIWKFDFTAKFPYTDKASKISFVSMLVHVYSQCVFQLPLCSKRTHKKYLILFSFMLISWTSFLCLRLMFVSILKSNIVRVISFPYLFYLIIETRRGKKQEVNWNGLSPHQIY